ncbi:hypothetical protein [Persephonella sp.]
MERITPDKVLKDPEFYQLPEFERVKVLEKIDPEFKTLPDTEKLKVVTAYQGKLNQQRDSLPEKIINTATDTARKTGIQFMEGAREAFDTLVNLESLTLHPTFAPAVAEAKQWSKDAKEYWAADKKENKFNGTIGNVANNLIREIPALMLFTPVMAGTGGIGRAIGEKTTRPILKSISENLGSGLGYTAVNLIGRDNYDWRDAGVDSAIDLTAGALAPPAARVLRPIGKKVVGLIDHVIDDVKSLFKIAKATKNKELAKETKQLYKSAKNNETYEVLKKTDELSNRDDLPEEAKKSIKNIKKKTAEVHDLPEPVKETVAETTDAYVDQLDLDKYKSIADKTAQIIKPKKFTRDEWVKEFSSPIKTPIGEVRMGDFQYEKMLDKRKRNLFPAIKPTLEDPLVIVKDKDGIVFIKPFIIKFNGEKRIEFISVKKKINGEDIIVSNHKIGDKKLENLLKGQVLYKNAAAFRSAGVHPQSPANNNINPSLKTDKGETELYAGLPLSKVLEHYHNVEKAFAKTVKGGDTLPAFTPIRDPEDVFKAIGKEKYYSLVDKAYKRQARLEKGYSKIISRINENIKTPEDKQLLENILHIRDKFKIEDINDIEKALGAPIPENIKKAYMAYDTGMRWAARLLGLNTVDIANSNNWKPYLQLITDKHLEKVINRMERRGKDEIAENLQKQLSQEAYFKNLPKKIEIPADKLQTKFKAMLHADNFKNPEMRRLAYNLKRTGSLYGYIPHVFNPYYVTDKNGNILATFKKQVEAEKFIKANPEIVNPQVKEFKFKLADEDALENPKKFKEALKERVKRLSFHRYIGFKEKRKGAGGWENFPYLIYDKEGKKIIGRFKTYEQAEKFAKEKNGKLVELRNLPEKDILKDTEWYLHKVARYRAMEDVKPELIRMFIQDYGLNIPKNTPIEELRKSLDKIQDPAKRREAKYVVQFINDVFGRPRDSEQAINDAIKKYPWLRKTLERFGLAYGDRPALSIINKTHKGLSYIYLGFKPIQFFVQLSTIPTNTWTLLAYQLSKQGVKHDFVKASEYVAKALYDLATNKRLRTLAYKMVEDNPTLAEIGQYTGKTFKKGKIGEAILSPLTFGDRTARAVAFLAKYEQLKAMGYKGNKARLAKEFAKQTNFSMKVHDTPSALRNPLIKFYMMYKPFLIKELNFLHKLPPKYRFAGALMLITLLGSNAFLGYELLDAVGITDLLYNHIVSPIEDAIAKTGVISKETLEELIQYGLIGALTGMALYVNMGLGDVYSAVLDPVKDLYGMISGGGRTSSAPLTYLGNIGRTAGDLFVGDYDRAKEDALKLLPSYFRKVKDAIDILTTGYIYRNGRPLIKASKKDAVALLLGATPTGLDKFYKEREEFKEVKDEKRINRDKLMKQLDEAVQSKDREKINQIVKQLVKNGFYKSVKDIKQAYRSWKQFKETPAEIKMYANSAYRQRFMEMDKDKLKALYKRVLEEAKQAPKSALPVYKRALENIRFGLERRN